MLPRLNETDRLFLDGAETPNLTPWGLGSFDEHDRVILRGELNDLDTVDDLDAQEAEQLADDRDGQVDYDVFSSHEELADPEVRAGARSFLKKSVGLRLGAWLTDQGFDARDRPGQVQWFSEAQAAGADVVQLEDRGSGCFRVTTAEVKDVRDRSAWIDPLKAAVAARLGRHPWQHLAFGGPVVLDIAVPSALFENDIDNVAGEVQAALAQALGARCPNFAGYRVYRQEQQESTLRVRFMPAVRLEALRRSMDVARRVQRETPRR